MNKQFALVTGASSGMGLEFAKQLAQRGYNLLIVSNEEAIHHVAKEIQDTYQSPHTTDSRSAITVLPLVMDLGRQESARELYEYTRARNNIKV